MPRKERGCYLKYMKTRIFDYDAVEEVHTRLICLHSAMQILGMVWSLRAFLFGEIGHSSLQIFGMVWCTGEMAGADRRHSSLQILGMVWSGKPGYDRINRHSSLQRNCAKINLANKARNRVIPIA